MGLEKLDFSGSAIVNDQLDTMVGAFTNCVNLKSIVFHPDTVFQEGMFEQCTSLEQFLFSDGVKIVPKRMFFACTSLKEVKGNGINRVESGAFSSCTSLEKVEFQNLEYVENESFCLTKIKSINANSFGRKALSECRYLTTINENVTTIE